MHVVAIPQVINAAGLLPFLAQLGSVPDVESTIVVDFSALRRVSPAGLVALVATVRHWQSQRGRKVQFAGLEQCSICGYLQRMDVLRGCGVEWPEGFERHEPGGRFVPVQLILDVGAMSREVAACLAPGGDDYEHVLSPLYDLSAYVMGELGANVRQHSGGTGFISAQVNASEGLVRLAVADNGRGIRQSFVDAGLSWSHGMSDAAAMRRALEPRISSKGEPVNQGVGLTLVSGLARLTEAWLMIASETGVLQINPGGDVQESALPGGARHRGTLLALTFRRDKLQDFYTLLDEAKQQAGLLVKRPIKTRFS
jgi:hypothetical protein